MIEGGNGKFVIITTIIQHHWTNWRPADRISRAYRYVLSSHHGCGPKWYD